MSKSQDHQEPISGFLIRSTIREPFFNPSKKAFFYFAERKIKQWPGRLLFSNNPKSEKALEDVWKTSRQGWNKKTMWEVLRSNSGAFFERKNNSKGRASLKNRIKAFLEGCFFPPRFPASPTRRVCARPKGKGSETESKISIEPRQNKAVTFQAAKHAQSHSSALPLLRANQNQNQNQNQKAPANLKRPWFFKGTNSYLIPDFVEIQRKSFFQLLENGLIEEFAKRNPITNKNLEIFFYPEYYQLTPPEYNPRRAILLSKSYSSKLFIPAQLTDKKLKKSQLKWVLIGNLPLMTKRGHFVLNGAPRVIVNQILRSPGIYFQGSLKEIFSDQWSEKAEITYKRFYTDLICLRGTWLRIEIDKNKDVWAQMKKVPKIPLLWFLLAMGLTERIIFKSVINPTRLLANFNPEIKRKIDYEYVTNASDAWKEISNLISSSNKESYAALSAGLLKGSSEATLDKKKQPLYIAKKVLLPSPFGLAHNLRVGKAGKRSEGPLFYKVKSATIFSCLKGTKNEGKPFKKNSSFHFELRRAFYQSEGAASLPDGPLVKQGGRNKLFPFAFDKGKASFTHPKSEQRGPNPNRPMALRKKEAKKAKKKTASSPRFLTQRVRSEEGVFRSFRETPHPITLNPSGDRVSLPHPKGEKRGGVVSRDHTSKSKSEPSQLSLVQSDKSNTALSLEPNIFKGGAVYSPLVSATGKTPRSGLNKGTLSWGSPSHPLGEGWAKRSSFLNIVEQSKEGRNWIFKRFMNPRAYDLGGQGRLNFNRKLGLSIDSNQTTLTAQDLLFATDYLFKVEKGLKNIDDIDHLKNRRVRTSGELLQIQIGIGLVRLEKIIREKLSKINAQTRASDFLTLTRGPCLLRKGGAVTRGLAGFADRRRKKPLFALWTFGSDTKEEHLLKAPKVASPSIEPSPYLASRPKGEEARPERATPLTLLASTRRVREARPRFHPKGERSEGAMAPLDIKKGGPGKSKRGSLVYTLRVGEASEATVGGGTRSAQTEEFKMNNLINTKAFNGALREFFGSSQLSQFMDQLNPLAEITHKRRLSSMGPGGVTRDSATLAIRGIHPTHYGRICPIETPEGKTVGLTNSLTTYARANPQGFLESPFYKVYKGQIQKSAGMFFLTAGQEENTKIAAADVGGSCEACEATLGGGGAFGRIDFLPKNKIPAKIAYGDTISKISRDQVEYIGVSPIQMISIATSLIPFVEHDDANRALMGSNMQRQAVPLVRAERPLVGTGLESRTVSDSGHAVVARESGYVAYVSAKKMIIYSIPIYS